MQAWRREGKNFRYSPPPQATWDALRSKLQLGQQVTGSVVWAPRRGAIGVGVDLGLPVGGFVDVLLLPYDTTQWPDEGTTTEFAIWWMDERPQIRLVPIEPRYRCKDYINRVLNDDNPIAHAFRHLGDQTPNTSS